MNPEMPVIEIRKLTKYYGRSRGIIDVDLSVSRGEVFGFLGPNGSGKSTTIRVLLDLIRPTSGSAMVNGMDPQRMGAKVRRSVGYLPSDFGTYQSMKARDYLRTLLDMMGHTGPDRVDELADRFQLDIDRRIKEFSRGNRQKVGLVSAFMHSPALVILDEPTTGLDPLMQQEFYKLIMEEKAAGRTVFLSSHILAEVEAICDRVGIIKEGKLIVVENIHAFKRKTGKMMSITFKQEVGPDIFNGLPGVSILEQKDPRSIAISVSSNVDGVIKRLANYQIEDFDYEELSLETMFLKYYEKEQTVDRKGRLVNGPGVGK